MTQLNNKDVKKLLPMRPQESSKNDYGRVLAVCGSQGYTGAAFFAAQGAVRMGSGVVTLAVPDSIYTVVATKLNEPVVRPQKSDDAGRISQEAKKDILSLVSRADAVLIGCGLGRSTALEELVQAVVLAARCPLVIDADGINALAGHIDVLRQVQAPCILTPHKGEFARISGIAAEEADVQQALGFAAQTGCVLLLKSHHTIIAAPDGRIARNTTGNAGMAKGGSGDILAGMLLSLLGQGLEAFDAACAGAWLHGKAGDVCAEKLGQYGMTPTDMLDTIPFITKDLQEGRLM